jgi:hypothetical protein
MKKIQVFMGKKTARANFVCGACGQVELLVRLDYKSKLASKKKRFDYYLHASMDT